MNKIELRRITDTEHHMYAEALKLYDESFPIHEIREGISQHAILKDPAYSFDLIFSRNEFIGLALFWTKDRFIYIEHLCILPEKRNMHYGEMTLDFLKQYGKILILEIDPPIDAISIRRMAFYERCGFCQNSFEHIHPPYHKEFKGHELKIMSYPEPISNDVYREFNDYLSSHIMADAF